MLSLRLEAKRIYTPPTQTQVLSVPPTDLARLQAMVPDTYEKAIPKFKTREEYTDWFLREPGDIGSIMIWRRLTHWNQSSAPAFAIINDVRKEYKELTYNIHGDPEWAQVCVFFHRPNPPTSLQGYSYQWVCPSGPNRLWRFLSKEELRELRANDLLSTNLEAFAALCKVELDWTGETIIRS